MHPIIEPAEGQKKSPLVKPTDTSKINLPAIYCLRFSNDGTKLLTCSEIGKVFCWDASQLGEDHTLLSVTRVSEKGVLSLSCN